MRLSLVDLNGVAYVVAVKGVNAKRTLQQAGLQRDVIREKTVAMLRRANIQIYSNFDSLDMSPGEDELPVATLTVRVDDKTEESPSEKSVYVYSLKLGLRQMMETVTGRLLWVQSYKTRTALGITGLEGLEDNLLRYAKDRVEEFTIDWLTAHQKR